MSVCVQPENDTAVVAVHSFNSTHHYEFVLHIANVTEFDLHRYDLEVSNDLGTTIGSVHVHLGKSNRLANVSHFHQGVIARESGGGLCYPGNMTAPNSPQ